MTSSLFGVGSFINITILGSYENRDFDNLPILHELPNVFPPGKLKTEERIKLGIKVLEKHGEVDFTVYQRMYRLTRDESESIFQLAGDYKKDLASWEPLEEASYQKDVDLVRSNYPEAKFSLLVMREENHRSMPIVEIKGKRFYFYSQAFKGPVVDKEYIDHYRASQKQESRPDFQILEGKDSTVFLMEFISEKTPDFRNEAHLQHLLDLIFRKSLNKKALDMLPCRLAMQDEKLYCVDQKLNYYECVTEIYAFKSNIEMLKGKICHRGYAEEEYLLSFVDKIAKTYEGRIFDKTIESFSLLYKIPESIPPSSLNAEQKIHLAAAVLKKFGTRELSYISREYSLSIEDQKKAKSLAGPHLIENIVLWKHAEFTQFKELYEKAEKVLQQQGMDGIFAIYLNRVGNFKEVLTVTIKDQIYVISEKDEKYIEQYSLVKEQQHRPDFCTFSLSGGNFLFLAKFMGSQTVDYSNLEHVNLIVDLALNFSSNGKSPIDFNYGNLLIANNQIFYIDKDLEYTASNNPRLTNLKGIFESIDRNLHLEHERVKSKEHVKSKMKQVLDPNSSQDKEILELFFPNEFKPKKVEEVPQSFEEFISDIDLGDQKGRLKLIQNLENFFITPSDFFAREARILAINEKLLLASVDENFRGRYLKIVWDKMLELLEAFIKSNE